MRWERMFADLEGQYDAAGAGELAAEIADRSRREFALVTVLDRLRAASGPVVMGVAGHPPVSGTVAGIGAGWVLLADASAEVLVSLAAVLWLRALPMHAESERSLVAARLDLGYLLRGIARDRAPVVVLLTDGAVATGTIDRVGQDFLDLAEHATDEPRRPDAVHSVRTVTFRALTAVRRG